MPRLLGPRTPSPRGGWFATGDLVSVADDGYVTVRGRRTELIITGGHNVYPAEVEAVLSRHPGVVEVAVVGLPSAEWGETVVAFVVGDPDLGSLQELAAAELAPFKCPREVRLDRRAAAQRAGQGGPERAPLTGGGTVERAGACGSVSPWQRSSCSPRWGRTGRRR